LRALGQRLGHQVGGELFPTPLLAETKVRKNEGYSTRSPSKKNHTQRFKDCEKRVGDTPESDRMVCQEGERLYCILMRINYKILESGRP